MRAGVGSRVPIREEEAVFMGAGAGSFTIGEADGLSLGNREGGEGTGMSSGADAGADSSSGASSDTSPPEFSRISPSSSSLDMISSIFLFTTIDHCCFSGGVSRKTAEPVVVRGRIVFVLCFLETWPFWVTLVALLFA